MSRELSNTESAVAGREAYKAAIELGFTVENARWLYRNAYNRNRVKTGRKLIDSPEAKAARDTYSEARALGLSVYVSRRLAIMACNENISPEKVRARARRFNGVRDTDLAEKVVVEATACAICNKTEVPLEADHDHSTGEVRGALCMNCNTALGQFKDSPEIMMNAINYLKQDRK